MTIETKKRVVPHSEADGAPTIALAQPYFTDPRWHRRDLELVFKRRWLFVGHATQLANVGDFLTYDIDKESVVVARANDGELHAFHNSCRHRGSRLCSATSGNAKAFMCPNHAWTYGLDGRLKTAARMPDLDKQLYSAVPVWVETWNGMVFINLSPEKQRSVAEHLRGVSFDRYALDRTKIIFERTYEVNSNWKLCAETYNECYHCALTHPGLVSLIDPLKDLEAWDDADAGGGDDFVIYTSDMRDAIIKPGTRSFTMDGQIACRKPLGNGVDWQDEIAALSWYPQFGVFAFPDHAYTLSWKPVSADKTLFRSTWMVHEDAIEGVDYDVKTIIALGDITNEEDTEVCENAQRGIESSGYRPGPYHPIFEGPVRGFNKVYLSQVGSDPYPESVSGL